MPPVVNGVEVGTLRETAARVTAAPREATSRSTVIWQGGLKSAAQSRDKPAVEIDEPAALGGQNSAATPVEMLLAALGSCVVSMVAARAADKGVEIRSMRAEVHGTIARPSILGLAPTDNPGLSSIGLHLFVDSPAGKEALQEIVDFAVKRSPVGSTIARGTPIQSQLTV
jgi:uncharacterized OsmC-like protein